MEEIRRLAEIAAHDCSLNHIFPEESKKNREGKFYSHVLKGDFDDDNQASVLLYGSNANDVKYKMLKHRLKKKLYNSLFFYDFSRLKTPRYHQKEQECIHLLHHAHLLYRLHEVELVINLTSKIKKISNTYEFLNFAIDALELEMLCYSQQGDLSKYNSSRKELDKCLKLKAYEREALTLFQMLRIQLKKSVKIRKKHLPEFVQDIERLKIIWKKSKSFECFNAYYKATIIYYELTGNFEAIVELTVASEALLKNNLVNSLRFDAKFNKYILVYAHFRAKKLKMGLEYAAKYLEDFIEGSPNWFAYLENYFLIAMYDKKYELAETIIHRASSNSMFIKLPAAAKERWTLYQAYYLLFASTDRKTNRIINPFLLSLPEYSKDKQGFNVAILILQFIFYLQRKETEALLYRIESLKKYILTHLKDTFSLRSKTLLKLLIITVTEDFDAQSSSKKGAKLYQRLIETPIPGDAFAEIEIVPYEHLWEHILLILNSQYK
ncbi:hypothetical protein [Pontibacter oryzae]|uniref:Uncharacterized protein n=1 Tax=Pontibacter oryzae TaxID=2304593 RepID=A0A399SHS7_9BACT|nr:hypothetical protein [Pontibacter oryzae]RIJ41407.1 hypothetical protein D1627_05030 [Pontibacter oryzae]